MLLPGGVLTALGIDRSFAFKQMTGRVELAIFEALRAAGSWPARVSVILLAALHAIGGREPTAQRVSQLTVGDRQFLLRGLGPLLVGDLVWHSCDCPACGQRLSVVLRYSDLPVKTAGASYPLAEVKTSLRAERIQFRVPTGEDQEAIQGEPEETPARRKLVGRLAGEPIETDALSEADLDRIEEAVEAIAPELGLRGMTECPDCRASCPIEFDLYAFLHRRPSDRLFEEVDQLAHHYHWSESEILDLPLDRRRIYLDLIDRRRGMHSHLSQFV